MMDMFTFPSVRGSSPEEQIAELVNYLIQFKETLEFALTNISTDNLSPALVNKLNELGANIERSNEERGDEVAQIATNSLTISDVCNSDLFNLSVKSEVAKVIDDVNTIVCNVNFETGHLEYETSDISSFNLTINTTSGHLEY